MDARGNRVLDGWNDRVTDLEGKGAGRELAYAYGERARALAACGHSVSAMEDLESAEEIVDGDDAWTRTTIHLVRGGIEYSKGGDPTDDYFLGSMSVRQIGEGTEHYDRAVLAEMCIEASRNILDYGAGVDAGAFVEKGFSAVLAHDDAWSLNRKLELLECQGLQDYRAGNARAASESLSEAIDTGKELMERGRLEDMGLLVQILVEKSDVDSDLKLEQLAVADVRGAVALQEQMTGDGASDALVYLYRRLADLLEESGMTEESEMLYLKAMNLEVKGNDGS